jgi:hypothetical protein
VTTPLYEPDDPHVPDSPDGLPVPMDRRTGSQEAQRRLAPRTLRPEEALPDSGSVVYTRPRPERSLSPVAVLDAELHDGRMSNDYGTLEYHADASFVELSGGGNQWYVTYILSDNTRPQTPLPREELVQHLSDSEIEDAEAVASFIERRLHAKAYEPKREPVPSGGGAVAYWRVNQG